MEIEEIGPDADGPLTEMVALSNAVTAHDAPWLDPWTVAGYRGLLRHGWDGQPPRVLAARDAGRMVAALELHVGEWDNRHLAWLGLSVHPELRRAGRGSELLGFALDQARALGRTVVGADGWESPALEAFAARHGFVRGSQAIQRRQYLAELDRDRLKWLYVDAEDSARDYELVRVAGATPAEMLDAVVTMTAAINDAPTDDLDIEDEVFTAERIRAYEAATLARGRRLYRLVARHSRTGELAGHTVVAVEEERPWLGDQHDTSVVRRHRGHRLGLLLKAGMLSWLAEAEPQLATIDTWNAESNNHMIEVNEALGYRAMGRNLEFQRHL